MKAVLTVAIVILLAGVFLSPVAHAQKTSAAHDQTVDFSNFKTFMFAEKRGAQNPLVNEMILAAVERELTAKGLTKVEANADVKVVYLAASGFNLQVGSVSFGYTANQAYRNEAYTGIATSGTAMWDVTTGTLVIDLLDKNDRTIFRGTAKDVLERAPSGNFAADAKLVSKQVNNGIAKIFKKYPKARR